MKPKVQSKKQAELLETEHYNKAYTDDNYWKIYSLNYDINRRIKYALKYLKPGYSVIDVGCGGGGVANGVAVHVKKVTGIDISPEGIKRSNQFKSKNTAFICTAIDPFLTKTKEKYDAVMFFECMEHLYNGEEVIQEITGVMKKGSILIMSTPNYNRLIYLLIRSPLGKLFYLITKSEKFKFKLTHSHIREYTFKELKSILSQNRLRIINRKGIIIWTDPIMKSKTPTLFEKINIGLGKIFPCIAGYMYIVAVYDGDNGSKK